jgi:hypothetical protein
LARRGCGITTPLLLLGRANPAVDEVGMIDTSVRGSLLLPEEGSVTARHGESYAEGVEPGEYLLQLNGGAPCTARLRVPEDAGAMTDVGTLTCVAPAK